MSHDPTPLRSLPIGSGTLTTEQASAWLERELGAFSMVLCSGIERHEDTHALATLTLDLCDMAQVCGRALSTGKPVTLAHGPDFMSHTRDLARLVATVGQMVELELARRALGILARELEARLAQEGAR